MSLLRSLLCCLPLCTAGLPAQGIFPPPPVPAGNPQTAAKALLGKALFWDEQLSSSRTVACGTCHVHGRGGSDPRSATARHPGQDGVFGTPDDVFGSPGVVRHDGNGHYGAAPYFGIQVQVTGRKAPSAINAAYQRDLFWDGRASRTFRDPLTNAVVLPNGGALESQAAGPPLSDVEMSHLGRTWADIAADLPALTPLRLADQIPAPLQAFVQGQTYAGLFQQVFGSPGVTPSRIVMAIAAYERTLVSDQSPFDRFLAGQATLSAAEARGLQVFQSQCAACHTDLSPQVLSTGPVLDDYRNVGVSQVSADPGRFAVTQNPLDQGRFKVPGLRNVALRAPYFHDGSKPTLQAVLDFYGRGGDFHFNQDPLILNIVGALSPSDKQAMIALLQALTDPRVANETAPFDRPRLWSEGARAPVTWGQGSVGSGGTSPRAIAVEPGFLGNPRLSLGVDRTAPGAFHLLAWDVAANPAPTVLLGQNVYLASTPSLVFVGIGVTQGSGAGQGWSSTTFAVPPAPGLGGATFYGQWVVLDAQGPNGLTVSDAFGLPVF